jgi:hypothetical protein
MLHEMLHGTSIRKLCYVMPKVLLERGAMFVYDALYAWCTRQVAARSA